MSKPIPLPSHSISRVPEPADDLPAPVFMRWVLLGINFGLWAAFGVIAWEVFRP